jgi:flavin-dependent dehydrogenase
VRIEVVVRDELTALGAQASMPRSCDVAIVGAGPAGSAAARWLARGGVSVALIERSGFQAPRIGESLAPAVQPELVALGLWREFQALDPLPSYGTKSHWGNVTPQVHSHMINPWGSGWHVDRRQFDVMLARAAVNAGACFVTETAVVGCRHSASGWTLDLRPHASASPWDRVLELRARVVIDATGRAAWLAAHIGAGRVIFDRLVGVASMFEGIDSARERYVMVESAAEGWWYSAPIPGGGLMVVAMSDADICGRSRLAFGAEWSAQLATTTATKLRAASCQMMWGPRVFSAGSHRLIRREWRRGWLSVGDAALAVDPISGSGVLRALRTAQVGADAALAFLNRGDPEVIRAYEAERDHECAGYLDERSMYYGFERRWPDSLFWLRRSQVSAIAS